MLSRRGSGDINDQEAAAFFDALGAGRARVGLALQAGGIADPLSPPQDFARRIRERYVGFQAIDVTSDPDGSAPDQDAVRAQDPGQEPRHLQRGADGGHARRPSGRLGVRSRSGDRSGASIARRGVVELSVDRRQRPERHDPALHREQPADAGRRTAARRRRGELRIHVRRHHAHLSGQRHVHAAPEGHLRHRAAGAGGGDEGGARRHAAEPGARQDGRGHQGRPAEARPDYRRQRRPVPDVVHARREPLHRHRRARRRRTYAAAAARHGVRHRAGHLHPPERARRAAADGREPWRSSRGSSRR